MRSGIYFRHREGSRLFLRGHVMGDSGLCSRVQKLQQEVMDLVGARSKLLEALIWCSGASDFAPGGKAHQGFTKMVQPILRDIGSENLFRAAEMRRAMRASKDFSGEGPMAPVMETKCDAERMGLVGEAVHRVEMELDRLHKAIEGLEQRIKVVLRSPDLEKGIEGDKKVSQVPLAGKVSALADSIEYAVRRVESMSERVEL